MARPSMIAQIRKRVMRNQKKAVIYLIIGILATIWIGGIFGQFSDLSSILTPFGDDTSSLSFTINPITCAIFFFKNLPHSLMAPLMLYALIGMFLMMKWKDKTMMDTEDDERGFKMENSGTYGTSRLMKEEDIKEYLEVEPLERTSGVIVGRIPSADPNKKGDIVSISPDGRHYKYDALGRMAVEKMPDGTVKPVREKFKSNTNKHIMVVGSSGCGKSYCFARPSILQAIKRKESIIITDPKGELYSDTARYAEERGYTVKILNLSYLQGSDSWDCLAELKGSAQIGIEAQRFSHIIIDNTSNPNGGGDEIYANGEENLLTALVLYVLTCKEYTGKVSLGGVYDLLSQEEEDLVTKFEVLPDDNPAKKPWNIFITASPNLRGNLKLGLGTRLRVLQDNIVQTITGVPDISLTLPGETPCAYYIIMPVMHKTYRFISSLFFSCLFDKLFDLAMSRKSQSLDVPVNVIMDEFIAIGKIPDFEQKLATVRSAGISISMIFQNLAQLQEEYPNGMWESLLSNCSNFICLACNDMSTAEYLTKRAGTGTIALENKRVDRSIMNVGAPEKVSMSYSVGERSVMQETELIKLASQGKLVLVPAGADIVVLDKFPYTDLVDPSTLEFVNMKEHTPAWAQQAKNYHMPQPKADVQTTYTSHSQTSMSKPEGEDEEEDILDAENEIPASPISPEPQQTEPPTAKEQTCSAPKQEASEAKQKKMQEQFVSSSNVVSGSDDFSDF